MIPARRGHVLGSAFSMPTVREGIAPMITGASPPFGPMLRRCRASAGLTQQELSERARLSVDAVSALERSVNQRPHKVTVARLADALALNDDERAALIAAARPPDSHASLPADAVPQPVNPNNLPLALTSFIGREQELATVRQLLRETRLLTLTGAGGCGKTRLALQAAGALPTGYPDGILLVELASLTSPELVPYAVTTVLGLPEHTGRPHLVTLVDFLRSKQLMLILDNCEHLVGACAELASALLQACGGLRILATSREGLEVPGETTYLVPSLAVPDPQQMLTAERLLDFSALRLFEERAHARRIDFAITEVNAAAIARICRRLDGIPLAIELAAARIDSMPVDTIAARLDDCFQLLTGGPRTALPRQKTLRAALDWSYGLLGPPERILLSELSVFAGGWTLEAAEAVGGGDGVETRAVLDLLTDLVRKSLVLLEERPDQGAGEARYRLLDIVRQYGQERLAATGGTGGLRDRHLGWCLALAEDAEPELAGSEQVAWLDRLEREHDNLRAALNWAQASGQVALGMRLAKALGRFWWMHGHLSEGRGRLEGFIALPGNDKTLPTEILAAAVKWAGVLAACQGDYERAVAFYQDSLALFQAMGDSRQSAECLYNLGVVAQHQGAYGQAVRFTEESLVIRRAVGDTAGMAESLSLLGLVATWQSDYKRAEALLAESLALYRARKDRQGVARALHNLNWPTKFQGNYEQAESVSEEGLALYRDLGDKQGIATMLHNLAGIAREQGDFERSATLSTKCLALSRELGSKREIATALTDLADVACYQGEYEGAEVLLAESLALYRGLSSSWGIAFASRILGKVARAKGNQARAAAFYKESLALYAVAGEKQSIAYCLEGLADLARAQRGWERAARLFGAAAALREAVGALLPPVDRPAYDQSIAAVHAALDVETVNAAWTAGRMLTLEEAIAEARETDTADACACRQVEATTPRTGQPRTPRR
jgi:predicted ATPase